MPLYHFSKPPTDFLAEPRGVMSETTDQEPDTPPAPPPPPKPTRYYRRQKVSAYRHTYMLGDGTLIEGEVFEKVRPEIDYTPPAWFEADTGKEVTDPAVYQPLEEAYRKAIAGKRTDRPRRASGEADSCAARPGRVRRQLSGNALPRLAAFC